MKPLPKRKSPRDVEPITLPPIQVRATSYPNCTTGFLHFVFADTCARVMEDGKEIGSISGCIGGQIELREDRTGATWTLEPRDLWQAFQTALHQHPEYQATIEHKQKESPK